MKLKCLPISFNNIIQLRLCCHNPANFVYTINMQRHKTWMTWILIDSMLTAWYLWKGDGEEDGDERRRRKKKTTTYTTPGKLPHHKTQVFAQNPHDYPRIKGIVTKCKWHFHLTENQVIWAQKLIYTHTFSMECVPLPSVVCIWKYISFSLPVLAWCFFSRCCCWCSCISRLSHFSSNNPIHKALTYFCSWNWKCF